MLLNYVPGVFEPVEGPDPVVERSETQTSKSAISLQGSQALWGCKRLSLKLLVSAMYFEGH